ncbi:SH3 domain-containing protein [Pelagibacterium limicola]|uniref:SH3 domain-containing protein n=1 Tax=Pelagibacterium limicola TaxID=2791022 RepID=UPI0018AF58BE|nr:SH3 domain-containing protein [Pelagibacterium limicola]
MNMRKLATAAIVALATLLGGAGTAFAYDAAATTTLNVRSGPGTNFRVVGVLDRNQIVQVIECNASNTWCRVQDRTLQGWASARYLQPVAGGTPPRPQPAPTRPDVGISITTPGFSIGIGTGRPGVTPPAGQICFFEEFDYRGRSLCVNEGASARFIERFWDNRIRSARVEGNVEATVCTQSNFAGRCAVIDRSVRNLGMLSDDISSYWVSRAR